MHKLIYYIVLLFFVPLFSLYGDDYTNESNHYQLGEGVKIPQLPLYLGGYISLDYRYKDSQDRYRIDDIAVLAYGDYQKFSYMAEFEFKEFYTLTKTPNRSITKKDTSLHTERLYCDYTFNENYQGRLGKYNSPIGFWNLLPVNVLRDTSSSPISTEILFPRFTTGALLSYTSYQTSELQIDLLLQHNNDLDPSYNNYEMDEHFGFGITNTQDELSIKFNIGAFDNLVNSSMTQHLYYALLSFQYETDTYKISSEVGTQASKDDFTTKYAGYLQGVYYFTEKHAAILRVESFEKNINTSTIQDNLAIFAYTYRPLFPVAIKTEYKIDSRHDENQFLFSFSVMF